MNIIGNEYDISIRENFREDVSEMCNLSQGILEDGIAIGEARGEARGLAALVASLKNFIVDTEELYQVVIKNETYRDTPREEVLKYLK